MTRCYVILVNWNGWRDTIECLESIFRLDYDDFRVVVCDNASGDDSVERLLAWAEGQQPVPRESQADRLRYLTNPPVAKPIVCTAIDRQQAEKGGDPDLDVPLTVIRTGGNLGFAGGNNVGLSFALARGDFDYVWLLNNDTVVDPRALSALVERMHAKPSAGMCGSTLRYYGRPDRIQARGGGWYCRWTGLPWHLGQLENAGRRVRPGHVERWMNYVVGASMLVSRSFLESIGLMCEDYFLYFEEVDWAMRSRNNFSLAYAPESVVYHKVGQSIGTSSDPRKKSLVCDYYALRNRIFFSRRFFPHLLPLIRLTILAAFLVRAAVGEWQRAGMAWNLMLDKGTDRTDPPEWLNVE